MESIFPCLMLKIEKIKLQTRILWKKWTAFSPVWCGNWEDAAKKWTAFPLFGPQILIKIFKFKKFASESGPWARSRWPRRGDDDVDVPPRPHPLPAPIQGTDFLGLSSVPRMGESRGWGRVWTPHPFCNGNRSRELIDPPHPPSPDTFFSGRAKGRGNRGVTYDASIFPAQPPNFSSKVLLAPGAAWMSWMRSWGEGQVRGTNAHPTTHSYLTTPLQPHPPRTTPMLRP